MREIGEDILIITIYCTKIYFNKVILRKSLKIQIKFTFFCQRTTIFYINVEQFIYQLRREVRIFY